MRQNLPGTVWQKIVSQFGAPPQWVPLGNVATGPTGQQGPPGNHGQQGPPGSSIVGPQGTPGSVNGAGIRGTIIQGRLSLDSANAVSQADQLAKSTLYFLPYINDGGAQNTQGNIVTFNGSSWNSLAFGSTSLNINGLTSGKNYDVFAYVVTNALNLTVGAAWTSDTARADALGTQDGVLVNGQIYASGACPVGIGLWVGTIRMIGAGTCEDSVANRFVWNAYNRVPRHLLARNTAANSYTYNVNTWRAAFNTTTVGQYSFQYVVGAQIEPVRARAHSVAFNSNEPFFASGIGIDSTTVNSSDCAGGFRLPVFADYTGYPGLGFHNIQRLESSRTTVTSTWYDNADLGGGAVNQVQSALWGEVFA